MGSFSWMRADFKGTKRANLTYGDSYKILIPKHLGGGYIKDKYFDYGYINYSNKAVYVDDLGIKYNIQGEHDLYGLLAYMNHVENMEHDKEYPESIIAILNNGNTRNQDNRYKGIEIGCYDKDINKLKYPLKLVSASYNKTYEEIKYPSYGDPNQGFIKANWDSYCYDCTYEEVFWKKIEK